MLRMTKQADYGIVLMTVCAGQPDRWFAAPELAAETRLPAPTVSKILKLLAREGLLESHRGVKGGYSLAHSPDQITVAAMISALDGPIAFTECVEDGPGACGQESVCGLRANWQRINQRVRRALESISLAELANPLPVPLVRLGSGKALPQTAESASAAWTSEESSPSHSVRSSEATSNAAAGSGDADRNLGR